MNADYPPVITGNIASRCIIEKAVSYKLCIDNTTWKTSEVSKYSEVSKCLSVGSIYVPGEMYILI